MSETYGDLGPRIGRVAMRPATFGIMSLIMSSTCFVSVALPYATFSFVPAVLFPWAYSPKAFLLWITACVVLSVIAGIRGSRLWFFGAGWAAFTLVFAMSAAL